MSGTYNTVYVHHLFETPQQSEQLDSITAQFTDEQTEVRKKLNSMPISIQLVSEGPGVWTLW